MLNAEYMFIASAWTDGMNGAQCMPTSLAIAIVLNSRGSTRKQIDFEMRKTFHKFPHNSQVLVSFRCNANSTFRLVCG